MKLLCLSNGHGEDAIALRILRAIHRLDPSIQRAALPLVGEGQAYVKAGIPVVGPVKAMPSGGFVYMDGKQLARDVQGGLLQLTWNQLKTVRQWSQSGGRILAVGDVVPLLFAWLSGVPYAFVGTAKSEYYLRDENGPIPRLSWFDHLERWSGSVYLPVDRWLMSRPHCKAVLPRDTLTSHILSQWSLPVYDLGNPMMDDLAPPKSLVLNDALPGSEAGEKALSDGSPAPLTIALLPGSRTPEAHRNWQLIVEALATVQTTLRLRPIVGLAAIAPGLDRDPFIRILHEQRWQPIDRPAVPALENVQLPAEAQLFSRNERDKASTTSAHNMSVSDSSFPGTLVLTQTAFNDCIHQADVAIAMAGTATEQFVGLGKPAITIPGTGPQFTPAFAEAQTRLLGPSVIMVSSAQQVGEAIAAVLANPQQREQIYRNGLHRMGAPGASERIARCLLTVLAE